MNVQPEQGRLQKDELRRILMLLLKHRDLDVPQEVDKTNLVTLNTVGLRGAIAECCEFDYYDNEPWDHWAAKTNSYHRQGQEAFRKEELVQVRDTIFELEGVEDV